MPDPGTRLRAGRTLSDRAVAALAVAAALGAWLAEPLPLVPVAAVVVGAVAVRRPWLRGLGLVLLTSTLSARATAGLAPVVAAPVTGEVTLVGDPEWAFGAVRADVRVGSRRLEAWARGPAASLLADRLTGERITLAGRSRPPPPDSPWLVGRHVVGQLTVDEVTGWRPGDPVTRLANGLRRTLAAGVEHLPPKQRTLFLGLLLGDDRDQPTPLTDDFLGAGLTHLLAVSGQNVAFVLAVVSPVLRRLRLAQRLPAALGVLAFFLLVTRFEPSVLRAGAMAGLATTAAVLGHEARGRRTLGLAVVLVLLIDPLLVHSVGFQLSVAASGGILLLGPWLRGALTGPSLLTEPIAITLAAQAGVAPLLIGYFEGVPVASLPANLLAGPAAGPVMVWGLTGGLVAGLFGGTIATVLHLPTRLLVGWIEAVAAGCAALPLGELGWPHLVALVITATVAIVARRRRGHGVGRIGAVAFAAALVVLFVPALSLRQTPPVALAVAEGATLWRSAGPLGGADGSVLVLEEATSPARLLEGLRRSGVRRLDVVVSASGGRAAADAVVALQPRYRPRLVLVPDGHRVPHGTVPNAGASLVVGGVHVRIDGVRPDLAVNVAVPTDARSSPQGAGVASLRAPGARAPPLRRHHPGGGHGHPQPHPRLVLRPGCPLALRRLPRPR
ncbi:hypothetical protein BH24ACT3_BH24ACT3_05930 [soil metagenome]